MTTTDTEREPCIICYIKFAAAGSAFCVECEQVSQLSIEKIAESASVLNYCIDNVRNTEDKEPNISILNYYALLHAEANRRGIQLYMYDDGDYGGSAFATIDGLFLANPLFFRTLEVTKDEAAALLKRKCPMDSKTGSIVVDIDWHHRIALSDTVKFNINKDSLKDGTLDNGKKYVTGGSSGAGAARYIDDSLVQLADLATDDPFAKLSTLWAHTFAQTRKIRELKA